MQRYEGDDREFDALVRRYIIVCASIVLMIAAMIFAAQQWGL